MYDLLIRKLLYINLILILFNKFVILIINVSLALMQQHVSNVIQIIIYLKGTAMNQMIVLIMGNMELEI